MDTINESILERFNGVKQSGTGYMALCPAHNDKNPSLQISIRDDGSWWPHCHAGCTTEDIVEALELNMSDLFPSKKKSSSQNSKIAATYNYHDESGNLLYQVVRTNPKNFFQRRPDGNGGWINGLKGTPTILYRLPELLRSVELGKTIFITEGEKDTDLLIDEMLLASTTAAQGAGKWKDHYSDDLIGANAVILPDNDEPGRKHALQVAKSMSGKATSIKIVELPGLKEKGDVTDWFNNGGTVMELNQLIENTPEWEPNEDNVVGSSTDATRFLSGRDFVPKRLADEIMSMHHFKFAADILWVYRDGVYKPEGERILIGEAQRLLEEETRSARIKETVDYVKRECFAAALPEPNNEFINVINGRLNWITKKLEAHDPKIFEIVKIPVHYDANATCPNFAKYLSTTLDVEVVPLAEELIGYCLIPYAGFEKAVMLTGSGANGKSVFLDTIQSMVGLANVSNIELQELEESRFKAAELLGKLVNVFSDLDDRALKSSSMFKVLVTGDRITAERKFGQPFSFINYARLLFSANRLPANKDRTHGFYRRWIIIPFNKTFDGKTADKDLRSKLMQELPGILNRAISGLHRLFDHEEFTMPPQVIDALEKYRKDNDSVEAFVAESVQKSSQSSISKQDFYQAYRQWCEEQGLKPFSQKKLKETLLKVIPEVTEFRQGNYGQWF